MYILLAILLLFILLLNINAVIEISYIEQNFEYHIKYGFIDFINNTGKSFNIFRRKHKSRRKNKNAEKKSESSSAVKDKSDNKNADKKENDKKASRKEKDSNFNDLLDKIATAYDLYTSSRKHLGRLIKGISLHELYVNFCVADENAYDCALKYGRLSAAVYNITGFLCCAFNVKKKSITVSNIYKNTDSIYDFSCRVRLRLGRAVTAAVGILIAYMKNDTNNTQNQRDTNKKNENTQENEKKLKECLFMNDHPVQGLMGTTIEKLRDMIDVNTIIGEPISTSDGTTIIPVSKVTFGFASGGSDLPTKQQKELFGGGSGAGMSIQPLAFICVSSSGEVKLLQMSVNASKENAIINTVPDLIDKISDMVSSKSKLKNKDDSKQKKAD